MHLASELATNDPKLGALHNHWQRGQMSAFGTKRIMGWPHARPLFRCARLSRYLLIAIENARLS